MQNSIQNICVFCGSSSGDNDLYANETRKIAALFLEQKIHVLYGAGSVGLMGVLAEEMLNGGGKITGVVPDFLDAREVVRHDLTELVLVKDMAERKTILMDRSDAFIALPGGFGTLDELFEVLTAFQLSLMTKPIAILNTNGYFDSVINFLMHAVKERFLKKEHLQALIINDKPEELLDAIHRFDFKQPENWIQNLIQTNKY
ncbi:MAG: TIGR00730 family Rossman fold protein [Bacteroidales bacterium]|nr:TIGR00730 family Rossman fold protein [Bacteroidales bacterium]